MPESSTILLRFADRPQRTTLPRQKLHMRTRPSIRPTPELSIKGTLVKSSRRQ